MDGDHVLTGDELKDARLKAGWTQEQLGARVGHTLRSVGNWERAPQVPRAAELKVRAALGDYLQDQTEVAPHPLRVASDAELLAEIARRFTREEQGHAKSTAAISRAGGSPAPGAVEDLDGRRRKHPRHPAYGPDHFNDDEATPPSRGDLSPEARPETDHDADGQADVHVQRAAQTRGHTPREFEAPDEGA